MIEDAAIPVLEKGDFGARAKLFFKRAFRSDLEPVAMLPDEHVAISVERVHGESEALRRVLLWRRAALFVAFCFQLVPTVVQTVKTFVQLGKDGAGGALGGLTVLPVLANIALLVAMWVAHNRWDKPASRKVLYYAWLVAFVGPFLLWLVPIRSVVEGGVGQTALIGIVAGLFVVVDLGPKALALIPGLIRAAIVTKTVFPSSVTPGWVVLLGVPFYLMLLYVLLLMPYQLAGGALMAPALILLMAGPVIMWRAGRKLVPPGTDAEVIATVKAMRVATLITNTLGGLFLMIALLDVFGEIKFFGPLDAILPLLHMIANVFLLSVVGLDAMLVQLGRQHLASQAAAYRASKETYESEIARLVDAAGIELPAAEVSLVAAAPEPTKGPKPAPKPAAVSPSAAAPAPKPVVPLKAPPPRTAAAPTPTRDDDPLGETQPGGPRRD